MREKDTSDMPDSASPGEALENAINQYMRAATAGCSDLTRNLAAVAPMRLSSVAGLYGPALEQHLCNVVVAERKNLDEQPAHMGKPVEMRLTQSEWQVLETLRKERDRPEQPDCLESLSVQEACDMHAPGLTSVKLQQAWAAHARDTLQQAVDSVVWRSLSGTAQATREGGVALKATVREMQILRGAISRRFDPVSARLQETEQGRGIHDQIMGGIDAVMTAMDKTLAKEADEPQTRPSRPRRRRAGRYGPQM